MADLSSILGGMVQGFKDFGTGGLAAALAAAAPKDDKKKKSEVK